MSEPFCTVLAAAAAASRCFGPLDSTLSRAAQRSLRLDGLDVMAFLLFKMAKTMTLLGVPFSMGRFWHKLFLRCDRHKGSAAVLPSINMVSSGERT